MISCLFYTLPQSTIDPYICAGFPLAQASDALKMLEQSNVIGKVVVTMNGFSI